MGKQAVMVDPHDADESETDEERKVRGPLAQQLLAKISAASARHLDLENQQGESR
jgi:hypothetical protein